VDEPVVSVKQSGTHTLGLVGMILAAVIGAGTIIGKLGDAFFVTRSEYVKLAGDRETEKKEAGRVIENANSLITAQTAAMDRMTKSFDDLKAEVEKLRAGKRKKE